MKIGVFVKQVPGSDRVKIDRKTGKICREDMEAVPNPLDLYALEAALRLREALGEGEVVAISMGPPRAREVLEEALAMGSDRAVLISDPLLSGSDTWVTAYVLASFIRREARFDLLVAGERTTDGETGQVGPELAALLDLPVVTAVHSLEVSTPGSLTVRRELEEGMETLLVELPAVVTVTKAVAEPRLPTLGGKKRARSAVIPVLTLSDLGLSQEEVGLCGSPTRVVRIFHPTFFREGEILEGQNPEKAAERLLQFLEARGML